MMLRAIVLRALLFCALWWVLTGGRSGAWFIGIITIGVALAFSLRLQPPTARHFSVAGMLEFFVFFLLKSMNGGLQVAAMALRPRLNLQPAILEIRLRLPHEAEQVFLAGTLNLLPGTLSVSLEGNLLQLHVLDARMPIEQEVRAAEAQIARLFRTDLQ